LAKLGRKCKLTPQARELILEILREGCTHRAAYGAARIHRETFYNYLRTMPDFLEEVRQAEAEAERKWLAQAVHQGRDMHKLLGLRFREDWGERVQMEPVKVQIEYVNDWRPGVDQAALPASGSEDGEEPGEEVQLAGGGETVEKDDPVRIHCA